MKEDFVSFYWTDKMIECKVEDETKFGTVSNPIEPKSNANCLTQESVQETKHEPMKEETYDFLKTDKSYPSPEDRLDNIHFVIDNEFKLPEGYIFKDENGNIINTTKIVLEKKKKEYPKTYEECCQYLEDYDKIPLKIIGEFTRLINARNAYWKIAGEEMGLGKPWEPTMETVYCISRNDNVIKCSYRGGKSNIFEFPTKEMRDAFKENFDKDLEFCKELL